MLLNTSLFGTGWDVLLRNFQSSQAKATPPFNKLRAVLCLAYDGLRNIL